MAKLLFALALGVLLSEMRLVSEARTPPYGVKLCGREFIRAVIFTCGGSRWRRADKDVCDREEDTEDLLRLELVAGNVGALAGGDSAEAFIGSSSSNEWDPIRAPLKDPADYYGNWRSQEGHNPLEDSWAVDRGARDIMAGLSSACCKWGCSKSEISSLC